MGNTSQMKLSVSANYAATYGAGNAGIAADFDPLGAHILDHTRQREMVTLFEDHHQVGIVRRGGSHIDPPLG